MSRKKSAQTLVADEQRTDGVAVADLVDRLAQLGAAEADSKPQVENAVPEAPQFGEATDPPAPETPATDAPAAEMPVVEAPAPPATNGNSERKHFLAPPTFNWLNSRASRKTGQYRNGRAVTVADEIRDEIRKGLANGEISKGEDGFVSHDLVVEMLRDYEVKNGFGSAGNPLDQETRYYFRSSPFRGWIHFRDFPEVIGVEPGDTVTLPQLKEFLEKMEISENGPVIACPGLDEMKPCNRQFQPIKGMVPGDNGKPLVGKNGKTVRFGAFYRDGDQPPIGLCLSCQGERRSLRFQAAKELFNEAVAKEKKDAEEKGRTPRTLTFRPPYTNYKPYEEVQEWIDADREAAEEAADRDASEARKKAKVSSEFGGKVGQIIRDAEFRSGKRGQDDRRGNRNERRWK